MTPGKMINIKLFGLYSEFSSNYRRTPNVFYMSAHDWNKLMEEIGATGSLRNYVRRGGKEYYQGMRWIEVQEGEPFSVAFKEEEK